MRMATAQVSAASINRTLPTNSPGELQSTSVGLNNMRMPTIPRTKPSHFLAVGRAPRKITEKGVIQSVVVKDRTELRPASTLSRARFINPIGAAMCRMPSLRTIRRSPRVGASRRCMAARITKKIAEPMAMRAVPKNRGGMKSSPIFMIGQFSPQNRTTSRSIPYDDAALFLSMVTSGPLSLLGPASRWLASPGYAQPGPSLKA